MKVEIDIKHLRDIESALNHCLLNASPDGFDLTINRVVFIQLKDRIETAISSVKKPDFEVKG